MEDALRVNDGIRKTVVFIGHEGPAGFIPHGTAFVVASTLDEAVFQSLVTCQHVVDGIPGDTVSVRANRTDGTFHTWGARKSWWRAHPEGHDVAVCPTEMDTTHYDILHLALEGPPVLTEATIEEFGIGIGDEVYIAGMYTARIGDTKNIPILRVGTIAAMPEEKINTGYGFHHAYLIEARSIYGLSGSPVLVHRPPVRIQDGGLKFQHGQMDLLMGMLLGHAEVENPKDTVPLGPPSQRQEDSQLVRVPWNTGIGIVLPISYVVETVNQPRLVAARRKAVAKELRQSADRLRPDSAGG